MIERLRAWGNSYTRQGRYSPVGIAFHWIMAALVIFQLAFGFWADWMMPGGEKLHAFQLHASVGLLILILAVGRTIWRILIDDPYNDADRLGWQTTLAHITALLFYATFFLLPLSGWIMWSAVAPVEDLRAGGVVPWPALPFENLSAPAAFVILDLAEDVHTAAIILLLVLIPGHVAAALKHHFWDRHDVLEAILPSAPDAQDPRPCSRHRQTPPVFPKESEAG